MRAYGRITPALAFKEFNRSLFITTGSRQVFNDVRFRKFRMFIIFHGIIFHDEVGHWLGNPSTKTKICVIYLLPIFRDDGQRGQDAGMDCPLRLHAGGDLAQGTEAGT